MENDHEYERLILCFQVFLECFTMLIEIADTHDEDDRIHQKTPEPDRARMDPHTIESDCESIETYRDEKHPRSRIGDECPNRLYEGRMSLLYREEICPSDRENDTEKSPNIDILP